MKKTCKNNKNRGYDKYSKKHEVNHQIKRITNRNIVKSNHLEKKFNRKCSFHNSDFVKNQQKYGYSNLKSSTNGFRFQIFIKLTISKIRLSI